MERRESFVDNIHHHDDHTPGGHERAPRNRKDSFESNDEEVVSEY
jgi:hypothetical protein